MKIKEAYSTEGAVCSVCGWPIEEAKGDRPESDGEGGLKHDCCQEDSQ